jgi:hypothetical protein
MSPLYIGIDNGVSGALAVVTQYSNLLDATPMPVKAGPHGREVDVKAVWDWMRDRIKERHDVCVIIEEPGGSKSAKAAKSMAGSFHALRAICELKGLSYKRITPQSWQKSLLGKIPAGETKPRALAEVRSLWPDEDWLATPRCKTAHDGMVDAALIGEYGRRTWP